MNDEDKKVLELYLKYIKKKRIIICIVIFIVLFICAILLNLYIKDNQENIVSDENTVQEENTQNEVSISNNTIENTTSQTVSNDTSDNLNVDIESSQENTVVESQVQVESKTNTSETTQSTTTEVKETTSSTSTKPSNKDFLFTDGYTMENVTQAAQNYLSSSGYSGEYVPIQDSDGVYLGMRVIFY